MSLVPRSHRPVLAVLFTVFVLFGASLTVIGAALPKALADFSWDYMDAGVILAAGSGGAFVSAYLAGRAVDRIGYRATLATGLALDTIALALFVLVPSAGVNAGLYFLLGVGHGFLDVAVNWSILRMVPGASGRPLSLMHGAFSAGAVAAPLAAGAALAEGLPWTWLYRGLALLFGLLLVVTLLVPARGLEGAGAAPAHHRAELRREPVFWLGFLLLLLYVGVELALSNWMAEYFVSVLKARPAEGAFAVSVFWGGLLAGRFGVPIIYRGPRHDGVLLVLGTVLTLATAALAATGFTGGLSAAYAASFAAGLGCSCIYPLAMSLVGEAFPRVQGEAMGFASAGGGLGALLFPLGTAYVARAWGLHTGYLSFIVLALAVLATSSLLTSSVARRRERVG